MQTKNSVSASIERDNLKKLKSNELMRNKKQRNAIMKMRKAIKQRIIMDIDPNVILFF